MEIEGIVHRILPVMKGTSAHGEWSKQEVVLEQNSEFNRKVCVSFWGDKVMEVAKLREGDKVNVSVNLESREYNGRWYTEVRAWRLQPAQQSAEVPPFDAPPIAPDGFESTSSEEVDDLPF